MDFCHAFVLTLTEHHSVCSVADEKLLSVGEKVYRSLARLGVNK